MRTEFECDASLVVHNNTVEVPLVVPQISVLGELHMIGMCGGPKARKDDRYSAADGFTSVQSRLARNKEAFYRLVVGQAHRLPGSYSCPEEHDLCRGSLVSTWLAAIDAGAARNTSHTTGWRRMTRSSFTLAGMSASMELRAVGKVGA